MNKGISTLEESCDRSSGNTTYSLIKRSDLWPSPENAFEIVRFGWLCDLAKRLSSQYAICPVASVALPLSVVGAMAGGSYWLADGEGLSVCAPINNLFIGAGGSMFRNAADNLWLSPRARLCDALFQAEATQPAARSETLNQLVTLRQELATLNGRIEKLNHAPQAPETAGWAGSRSESLSDLVRLRSELILKIRKIVVRSRQLLLVEGRSLEELLQSCATSFDNTSHHLSTDGAVIPRLSGAPHRLLTALAQLSHRLWTSRFSGANLGGIHEGILSHHVFLRVRQAQQLINDAKVRSSGLIDSFIYISLDETESGKHELELSVPSPWTEFIDVIGSLITTRESLQRRVLKLTDAADGELTFYLRERHRIAKGFGAACPSIMDRIGPLAMKFSLQLHLAREVQPEECVAVETVRAACLLTDAVLSGHLKILDQLEPSPTGGEDSLDRNGEFEIILERLRVRGTLSRRELARTFHDQRVSKWEPKLAKAVELGKVVQIADGRFALPEGPNHVV